MRWSPRAPDVLRDFGIDTCCGRQMTLAEAAASAGVALDAVLEALAAAGRGEPP